MDLASRYMHACSTGEIRDSRLFSDCRSRYRKLDFTTCENAGGLTNTERYAAWSQSLKTAKKSPPPPIQKKAPQFKPSPPPIEKHSP